LIFLLNLLHGYAALPFIYICSFLYSDPASAYSTLVILLFLITSAGCLGSVFMEHYVEDVSGASLVTAIEVALNLLRLLPSFSYSRGMMKIIQLARENDICQNGGLQLEGRCQTKEVKGRLSLMQCCMHKDSPDPSEYMIRPLDVNTYSAFYEFVTLSVEGLAAFVLLLCLESWIRKQDRALSALDSSAYEEGAVSLQRPSGAVAKNLVVDGKKDEDTDVALENKLVKALVNSQAPVSTSRPFVIVNRLFKAYGYIECNPVLQGLTFTVRIGECFGLLGVNGAGKTTTFRVLTGEILPNYGDAIIANFSIVHDRKNCWHYMGYCPQRDGLLDMLTGMETVLLFGRLRGIPITNDYLSALLNIFRLQEIADYLVGTYSAGNRRKLSMCISMIGLPRIVLLDEPYAAISTTARRQIVNYVSALQKVSKMSILLSSHSLSDIEFLCNRIAIMDAGKLQCLGSLGKLKEKFGKGYTLTIKTYPDKRLDYSYQQDVTHDVCKAFQEAEVVYCYEGVLEFRMLRVHMLLSDMFLRMARIKHRHKLQDFYISDTSLEQIFKSVTRKEESLRTLQNILKELGLSWPQKTPASRRELLGTLVKSSLHFGIHVFWAFFVGRHPSRPNENIIYTTLDERAIDWIRTFQRLIHLGKHRAYLRRCAEIVGGTGQSYSMMIHSVTTAHSLMAQQVHLLWNPVGLPAYMDLHDPELRRALNGHLADDSQLWPENVIVSLQPDLFYELNATHFTISNLTENFKLFLGAYVVWLFSPYASSYLITRMLEDMGLESSAKQYQHRRCTQALENILPLVMWEVEHGDHNYRLYTWKMLRFIALSVNRLEEVYGDAFREYFTSVVSRVGVNAWNMTLRWEVLDSVYSYVPFDSAAVFLDMYIRISVKSIGILKKSLHRTTLTVLQSPGFATFRLYRMLVAREVIVPNYLRTPPLFDVRHPLPVLVALVANVVCRELTILGRFILYYDRNFTVSVPVMMPSSFDISVSPLL
ncbi:hypothetical protein MRX96_045927, partial [Rhipicephalus microplus]